MGFTSFPALLDQFGIISTVNTFKIHVNVTANSLFDGTKYVIHLPIANTSCQF